MTKIKNQAGMKAAFLKNFAECFDITLAAARAGFSRRTVYSWRETDAKFSDELGELQEQHRGLRNGRDHRWQFTPLDGTLPK
ncbi:hypothetical protein ACFLYR_09345 [Chloroflexota bacterium]